MFFNLLLTAIMAVAAGHIYSAKESFDKLTSYTVTLNSKSSDSSEEIKYYFKKPGLIRMEFIEPHKGAVLVYNPHTKRVKLRPFGFFRPFVMDLSPEDRLVKSSKGHTVDESDLGALLKAADELAKDGKTEEKREETIGQRQAALVRIEGRPGKVVGGVHAYNIWFDKKTGLPIKAESFDSNGELIEKVAMDDLEVNPTLPDELFDIG